jgi:hypothetical protein
LVIVKEFPGKTQSGFQRITQRSTGRQKQSRFLPFGKLLAKERSHFKRNSFFAFAACELSVIRLNFTCSFIGKRENVYFRVTLCLN